MIYHVGFVTLVCLTIEDFADHFLAKWQYLIALYLLLIKDAGLGASCSFRYREIKREKKNFT